MLFPSVPKAHLIHGQAYSATENNNDEILFRCSALKLFPKLTAAESHKSRGSSSSPSGLHVHTASTTSPPSHSLPPSAFLAPSSSSHMTDKLGFPHSTTNPKTEVQHLLPLPLPHHKSQPGPLLTCFPTTHWPMKVLAPCSLSPSEPSSAVLVWASSWGGRGENTAAPNLASVSDHTGVTGQHPCPVQRTSHATVCYAVHWDAPTGCNFPWGSSTRKLKGHRGTGSLWVGGN